ncbi:ATPase [Aureococcus anophagefferens]|nr:ATPase [Aureococcus anophagefferens]
MEALPAPSRDSEAQLLAMLSKLWLIRRRDRTAALQIFGLPAFALSLCALVYEVFGRGLRHSTGYFELVVVPLFGVSAFSSSLATTLVAERSQGLLETMKIMSLSDGVYQIAHVFEALALGAAAAETALALLVASAVEREQFAGQLMFFGQVAAAPPSSPPSSRWRTATATSSTTTCHRGSSASPASTPPSRSSWASTRSGPADERGSAPYRGLPEREIIRMLVIDAVVYFVLARLELALRSEYGSVAAFYERAAALCRACVYGVDDLALMEPLLASEHARPAPGALQDAKLTHGTPPSVVCRDLRKVYGGKAVVDDLSLDMYEGEIFSLLGHNGAGKSTTCGLLTGIVASDSKREDGGAVVYGHGIRGGMTAVRQLAGFCPQHDCLFEKLSCYEHVVFFGRLKGRAQADAERAAADLLDRFRLGDRRSDLACELSGGMRRKLSTAIALCGGSKFALLDEPTAGMDALARRELWDLLAAVKRDRTFLKRYYGAGYRVVCERNRDAAAPPLRKFDELLALKLGEGAKRLTEGAEAAHNDVIVATLPSTALPHFAIYGLLKARLNVAKRSKADAFNALFPILGFFASFLCDKYEMFGKGDLNVANDFAAHFISIAFMAYPAAIAARIIHERRVKLRSLLATIVLVAWVLAHKRFPKIFTKARVETGQFWLGAVTSPYTSFWIGFFQMGAGHFKKYVSKQTVYPTPRDIMVVCAAASAWLLGANGAGKSTTLNMIIRHTVPLAGTRIMGPRSTTSTRAKHLGVVDQHNTLWDSLSAQDHLELFAMLRGCPRGAARARVDACLEDLELKPHAAKLSCDLSGGMKRKLCCAIALIGDPACVLLDEPSAGSTVARNLWNVLGATMSAGRTPQHLVDAYGRHYELTLVHTLDADPAKLDEFVHASFSKRSSLDSVMQNRRTYLIDRDAVDVASAFRSLEKRKKALGVDEYMFNQPSLEQVFLKFAASLEQVFLKFAASAHGATTSSRPSP